MSERNQQISRARLSLEGLSVGDAFGQTYFGCNAQSLVPLRHIMPGVWPYTDDTVMAICILENLIQHGRIVQDELATAFANRYAAEPDRGYGASARSLLRNISEGIDWRTASAELFDGMGSMGNGGAMRAGVIGAYFAGDMEAVVENARLSAEVTHWHPEGQAGAIAIAVAAAFASERSFKLSVSEPLRARSTAAAAPDIDRMPRAKDSGRDALAQELFDACIRHTPDSQTREGIIRAAGLDLDYAVSAAANTLGSGYRLLSQDTVPFSIWCAARHLDNYEEALWTTVSGFGDMDTTCAIVGSIVACRTGPLGIPREWRARAEPLPIAAPTSGT